jgi:hypothetical protein
MLKMVKLQCKYDDLSCTVTTLKDLNEENKETFFPSRKRFL